MSRTAAKFTQADIARVLRAIEQIGGKMEVVLEPDGRIRIAPAKEADQGGGDKRVDLEREIRL